MKKQISFQQEKKLKKLMYKLEHFLQWKKLSGNKFCTNTKSTLTTSQSTHERIKFH